MLPSVQHDFVSLVLTIEQPLAERGIVIEAFFAVEMRYDQQTGPRNAPFRKLLKLSLHPLKAVRGDVVQGNNEGRSTHASSISDKGVRQRFVI